MQTPLPRSGQIYKKGAKCAETNEKLIFRFLRFLFFEIWSILYSTFVVNWSGTYRQINHFFMLGGLRSQVPGAFGFNPPT